MSNVGSNSDSKTNTFILWSTNKYKVIINGHQYGFYEGYICLLMFWFLIKIPVGQIYYSQPHIPSVNTTVEVTDNNKQEESQQWSYLIFCN
jgi:hypothetical protein